jgi:hypothetical protein
LIFNCTSLTDRFVASLNTKLNSIITYFIVGALGAGLLRLAYITFVGQPTKKSKKRSVVNTSDTASASATGAGGYQEEWIPEHHLSKKGKKGAASGEELSGGETSGAEARKRRGRK